MPSIPGRGEVDWGVYNAWVHAQNADRANRGLPALQRNPDGSVATPAPTPSPAPTGGQQGGNPNDFLPFDQWVNTQPEANRAWLLSQGPASAAQHGYKGPGSTAAGGQPAASGGPAFRDVGTGQVYAPGADGVPRPISPAEYAAHGIADPQSVRIGSVAEVTAGSAARPVTGTAPAPGGGAPAANIPPTTAGFQFIRNAAGQVFRLGPDGRVGAAVTNPAEIAGGQVYQASATVPAAFIAQIMAGQATVPAATGSTGGAIPIGNTPAPGGGAPAPGVAPPPTTPPPAGGTDAITPAMISALSGQASSAAEAAWRESQLRGMVMRPVLDANGKMGFEPVMGPNGQPITTQDALFNEARIKELAAQSAMHQAIASGRVQDPQTGAWINTPSALRDMAAADLAKSQAAMTDAELEYTKGAKTAMTNAQAKAAEAEAAYTSGPKTEQARAETALAAARTKKEAIDAAVARGDQTGVYIDPETGQQTTTLQSKKNEADIAYLAAQTDYQKARVGIEAAVLTGTIRDPITGQVVSTLAQQQQVFDQQKAQADLASNPRNYLTASFLANARGGLGGQAPTNQVDPTTMPFVPPGGQGQGTAYDPNRGMGWNAEGEGPPGDGAGYIDPEGRQVGGYSPLPFTPPGAPDIDIQRAPNGQERATEVPRGLPPGFATQEEYAAAKQRAENAAMPPTTPGGGEDAAMRPAMPGGDVNERRQQLTDQLFEMRAAQNAGTSDPTLAGRIAEIEGALARVSAPQGGPPANPPMRAPNQNVGGDVVAAGGLMAQYQQMEQQLLANPQYQQLLQQINAAGQAGNTAEVERLRQQGVALQAPLQQFLQQNGGALETARRAQPNRPMPTTAYTQGPASLGARPVGGYSPLPATLAERRAAGYQGPATAPTPTGAEYSSISIPRDPPRTGPTTMLGAMAFRPPGAQQKMAPQVGAPGAGVSGMPSFQPPGAQPQKLGVPGGGDHFATRRPDGTTEYYTTQVPGSVPVGAATRALLENRAIPGSGSIAGPGGGFTNQSALTARLNPNKVRFQDYNKMRPSEREQTKAVFSLGGYDDADFEDAAKRASTPAFTFKPPRATGRVQGFQAA